MKRGIIIALLCLLFYGLHAQVNHPFIDTNSTWRMSHFYHDGLNPPSIHSTFEKFQASSYVETDSVIQVNGFLEEKATGKVYKLTAEDTVLLYDFSMEVGDSIFQPTYVAYCSFDTALALLVLDSIGTVGLDARRVFHLTVHYLDTAQMEWYTCETIQWIEGVGKRIYPFSLDFLFAGSFSEILCYRYNDTTVFLGPYVSSDCTPYGVVETASNATQIYPNPSDGIIYIAGTSAQTAVLYDLYGRRIGTYAVTDGSVDASGLQSGVYFLELDGEAHKVVLR